MQKNNLIHINQKLSFIGFRIAYDSTDFDLKPIDKVNLDIERTLIDAAYLAMDDFRVLSILMTWVKVHGEYVIVEKFFKLAKIAMKERGHNPVINGIAVWGSLCKQTKWTRYIYKSKKNEFLVDKEISKLTANYKGYKADWLKLGVKVPLKLIRIREADVYTAKELAKNNLQFRNRLIIGSSWRSDIVTAIDYGLTNPYMISKTIGCSYEPAHRVFREYNLTK